MKKPYLTKLWYGRWWFYIDTDRKFAYRTFRVGWHAGIISYKKIPEQ